jgi:carboxypeptidase Q
LTRLALTALLLPLWAYAGEPVDLDVVHRIQAEAFTRSKVMNHLFHISDVAGPRLTNSPAFRESAEWIRGQLKEYGIGEVRFEEWGPFGPGWECTHFSAHLREPQYAPLIGFPLGWSQGTNGKVSGEPLLVLLSGDAEFAAWKGKLKGRIVMTEGPRDLPLTGVAPAGRLSRAELAELERLPDPVAPPLIPRPASPDAGAMLRGRVNQFLIDEGVALLITAGQRGDFGTIMAKSVPSRSGVPPMPPPTAAIAAEQYNRMARLILKHIPVAVDFDIRVRFLRSPASTFNVIAEIPGGSKRGEVVMVGGHLDSWNSGTGAVDDGAGVAVVMEAARILKALDLKMDRTVRFAFWAAEEHGLLGSKAYLEAHKAELARISCYLNDDGGAGRVRGVFLQGNSLAREPFAAWLAPFRDLSAATISPRSVHGSDHDAFDAAGVPGFQFIQDPLDYFTRAHHSNMDLYDRAPAGDLMQTAAILASLAYHAATRAEMMPRKPEK